MAPIEDLQSRDLAWISDFVMQQMVIMMRPLLDHLQQTEMTVEYVQQAVQRLCVDMSEVHGDVERSNKYLGILRQGLGVQNESKCMMQRGIDSSARTCKRLDDQMDSMMVVIRGMEDSLSQVYADMRGAGAKHEELSKVVAEESSNIEDLQAKLERVCNDAHSMKDGFVNNEARLEVWQRELRELRWGQLGQLGVVSKLEDKTGRQSSSRGCGGAVPDSWPQKKNFTTNPTDIGLGGGNASTASTSSGANMNDICSGKRLGRANGSVQARLQQDLGIIASTDDGPIAAGDEAAPSSSRLPLLAACKASSVTRPPEGSYTTAPRLRFSETMVRAPSRGPNGSPC